MLLESVTGSSSGTCTTGLPSSPPFSFPKSVLAAVAATMKRKTKEEATKPLPGPALKESQSLIPLPSVPPNTRGMGRRGSTSSLMISHDFLKDLPCLESRRCFLTEKEHGLRLTLREKKTRPLPFPLPLPLQLPLSQPQNQEHRVPRTDINRVETGNSAIAHVAPGFAHLDFVKHHSLNFINKIRNRQSTGVSEDTSESPHTSPNPMETKDSHSQERTYEVTFTKNRSKNEEWYVHLQTVTTTVTQPTGTIPRADNQHHQNQPASVRQQRILQLRHCITGKYLYSDDEGNVGVQTAPTAWAAWILEPALFGSDDLVGSVVGGDRRMSFNSHGSGMTQLDGDTEGRFSFIAESPPAQSNRVIANNNTRYDENNKLHFCLTSRAFDRKLTCSVNSFDQITAQNDVSASASIKLTTTQTVMASPNTTTTTLPTNSARQSSTSGEVSSFCDDGVAVWEFEFTSGELCFLSNPVMHSQVRCNPLGQLSLVSNKFSGWEVFRFIEVGGGGAEDRDGGAVVISSWTHSNKFLASDPDGQVYTTENRLGHWEKWKLSPARDTRNGNREDTACRGVHIISIAHPGRFLSVGKREGEALCTTTRPNDYAVWHVDAAHSNVYFLAAADATNKNQAFPSLPLESIKQGRLPSLDILRTSQLYISSSRKGSFLTKNRRDWEQWKMEVTRAGGDEMDGDGEASVAFYSIVHQKYLGCNSAGNVHTTTTKGNWSLWEMAESPWGGCGGVYLRSKAHGWYLSRRRISCGNHQDNESSTVSYGGGGESMTLLTRPANEQSLTIDETWRLEPRLPPTISGTKLLALGAAGAVGVALTVAMPYAVIGGVVAEAAISAEAAALAGGAAALLGASAVVGTTAAAIKNHQDIIHNDGMNSSSSSNDNNDVSPTNASSSRPETIQEDSMLNNPLRPISSWRNW